MIFLLALTLSSSPHFDIAILACEMDHCEHFITPVDADNEVACMMTSGLERAARWQIDHPSWKILEWHCAKPGEADL